MTSQTGHLRECPDCGRLFNTRVNQARCPACGIDISVPTDSR